MSLYHVTTLASLPAILQEGIEPSIGPRSARINEITPAIYLFPTVDHVADALGNWLGDEFEDEDELVVLEVEGDVPETPGSFEVVRYERIDPAEIVAVLDESLVPMAEFMDGLRPL